jgi:AbrB family looped-hinge helix DNA binding protein
MVYYSSYGKIIKRDKFSVEVLEMNGTIARIADGGRLVIPAEYRRRLGLEPGDEVIMRIEDGELRILTRAEAVKRAQAVVRQHVKKGRSLVDELSAERRAEAARE